MAKENITITDGQRYFPGDKVWNLGSFVATSTNGKQRH